MSAAPLRNAPSTILTFPGSDGVESMLRAARRGMLEFANGALFWDKAALAKWLVSSYAPVTKIADDVNPAAAPASTPPRANVTVLEPRVFQVLNDARQSLIGALRLSMDGRSAATSAWKMIREGALTPCEDSEGDARGFMPVAYARMRLRDRVLSLWAADFMAHPEAYGTELVICSRCGLVEFDAIARARGTCRAHKSTMSGVPMAFPAESETRIRIKESG